MGGVDLAGVVGDDRRAVAEDIERVDESMEAHRVGTGEAELDDLRRREDSAELAVDLVVDGMVVGREKIQELDRQALLLGQLGAARRHQAGDVLVGDRIVLTGLHAGLALAQLRATDPDQLEDSAPEQALLPPCPASSIGHQDLLGPVGEDLEGDGGGVGAVGHPVLDDPSRLLRQLVQWNRFNSWHAYSLSEVVGSPSTLPCNELIRLMASCPWTLHRCCSPIV